MVQHSRRNKKNNKCSCFRVFFCYSRNLTFTYFCAIILVLLKLHSILQNNLREKVHISSVKRNDFEHAQKNLDDRVIKENVLELIKDNSYIRGSEDIHRPTPLPHSPRIPYRLILSDKAENIKSILPVVRRQNTWKTIEKYRIAFGIEVGKENEFVWYLNDSDCVDLIERVYPVLTPYFLAETVGMYKSDICRIVALYDKGGYYIDTDMEIIDHQTIIYPPNITMATVWGLKTDFFFSILLGNSTKASNFEAKHGRVYRILHTT